MFTCRPHLQISSFSFFTFPFTFINSLDSSSILRREFREWRWKDFGHLQASKYRKPVESHKQDQSHWCSYSQQRQYTTNTGAKKYRLWTRWRHLCWFLHSKPWKKSQIVLRLELDDIWSAKVFNSVRILILLNDVTRTRKILICLPFFWFVVATPEL